MVFYRLTDAQSAQIQAVGASLQVGSTIFCIAPNSWKDRKGRLWFRLILWAPDYQRGIRTAFELRVLGFGIKRRSAGVYADADMGEAGWSFE